MCFTLTKNNCIGSLVSLTSLCRRFRRRFCCHCWLPWWFNRRFPRGVCWHSWQYHRIAIKFLGWFHRGFCWQIWQSWGFHRRLRWHNWHWQQGRQCCRVCRLNWLKFCTNLTFLARLLNVSKESGVQNVGGKREKTHELKEILPLKVETMVLPIGCFRNVIAQAFGEGTAQGLSMMGSNYAEEVKMYEMCGMLVMWQPKALIHKSGVTG